MIFWRVSAGFCAGGLGVGQAVSAGLSSLSTGSAEGAPTGRQLDAHRWTIASFRQHTSRDNDPQIHVHNAIWNRVQVTSTDPVTGETRSKWLAIDGQELYLPAHQGRQAPLREDHRRGPTVDGQLARDSKHPTGTVPGSWCHAEVGAIGTDGRGDFTGDGVRPERASIPAGRNRCQPLLTKHPDQVKPAVTPELTAGRAASSQA
ncbi:relaxase domain-containing protein [Streptomyces sp. PSKA54]|uniref:Relaxase domain-containing protein n=1 Tax=Streptomyces himalayensis subsp. aureolus TaxID=2758039 RepID=A0A7W2D9M2_9ACTN|nr:relaxase domain-containing protein [Streptomyces himalayensis]MBA4867306.1 relaxase domain-containing protein [Streptomyces himalayensis subsp. aureolus]